MARRKLATQVKSTLKPVLWLVVTLMSGGGISAYFNNWPIVGPLLQSLIGGRPMATAPQYPGSPYAAPQYPGTQYPGTQYPGTQYPPPQYTDLAGNLVHVLEDTLTHVQAPAATSYPPVYHGPAPAQPVAPRSDKLLIASFNIQVFGESKLEHPEVVNVLAQVVRQFDIVAIQEVRSKIDVLPRFLQAINSDGSQYSFLIGPRLGRTVSTEQYAFIFDTRRVECDPSATGTFPDPQDQLHREPFVARFRTRTSMPDQAFTFWLVDIHTDPDLVPQEVAALANVFQAMQRARPDEDDVILLGDLNASETQLGPLGQIPGIHWVVSGAATNTRQDHAYDNILFNSQATSEYTGRWGVLNLERTFGLSQDQALLVSDHFPIWAEFSPWETQQVARFGPGMPR